MGHGKKELSEEPEVSNTRFSKDTETKHEWIHSKQLKFEKRIKW